MEKVYKTMQRTGACSIAVGIIMLVTGVTVGIMSIVCGGLLLKRKGEITFKMMLGTKDILILMLLKL